MIITLNWNNLYFILKLEIIWKRTNSPYTPIHQNQTTTKKHAHTLLVLRKPTTNSGFFCSRVCHCRTGWVGLGLAMQARLTSPLQSSYSSLCLPSANYIRAPPDPVFIYFFLNNINIFLFICIKIQINQL